MDTLNPVEGIIVKPATKDYTSFDVTVLKDTDNLPPRDSTDLIIAWILGVSVISAMLVLILTGAMQRRKGDQ